MENYIEKYEDIGHTKGSKELYARRKEIIERIFGTAKEQHGFFVNLLNYIENKEQKPLMTPS